MTASSLRDGRREIFFGAVKAVTLLGFMDPIMRNGMVSVDSAGGVESVVSLAIVALDWSRSKSMHSWRAGSMDPSISPAAERAEIVDGDAGFRFFLLPLLFCWLPPLRWRFFNGKDDSERLGIAFPARRFLDLDARDFPPRAASGSRFALSVAAALFDFRLALCRCRRCAEFHRFFTAFSLRPGRSFAI